MAEGSFSKYWEQFQRNASGEWEGITATFNSRGEALELPEHYVPSAYREWDVHLYDWQSLCSMQVNGQEGLRYSLKRMMPTVGCEADAVAFTEEAQEGLSAAEASELGGSTWPGGLPWAPDGSYALVPLHIGDEEAKLRVESCLVRPRTGPLDAVSRTRVVHHLKRQADSREWQIDSVEVHQERFLAPYNGGGELAGCGGGMSAFAQKPRPTADALSAAAARAGDGCDAVQIVKDGDGFVRKSGSLSFERLLSAASAEGLVLPSGVVTVLNSKGHGASLEVKTAVQFTNSKSEAEALGAVVVCIAAGSLQEVSLAAKSLLQ
ncbi:hypothetical protein COCOBI_01-0120 [Coccomyxa sp. Obi]|nr:hypothetical protein COCOBI_01-0120 [Coccomyxa sp. Obi]